ncbi:hypothetical protein NG798_15975 [Ancylothrix sp. C2]|uniref:hypothetical protein n=1 Tax=Ancylothrix sp. D3o TaxID=2953691 RepID=UPI0021BBA868|nr:hypothetical protein [Ancylothrix sp. D3o]MCT7951299.1 hypothetical protein [Ancylothrix sp. D3o]
MKLPRRLINPKSFVITINQIAKFLKIDPNRILRYEKWPHVLWVHIKNYGGLFISYRKLEQWITACRVLLQATQNLDQLSILWKAIKKEAKRYSLEGINRLTAIWQQQKAILELRF